MIKKFNCLVGSMTFFTSEIISINSGLKQTLVVKYTLKKASTKYTRQFYGLKSK